MKKLIFFILCALSTSYMYSVIISTQVLKNHKTQQTVVLYGDFHTDYYDNKHIHESALQSSKIFKRIFNAVNHSSNNNKIKFLFEGFHEKDYNAYVAHENPLIRLFVLQLLKGSTFKWAWKKTPRNITDYLENNDVRPKQKELTSLTINDVTESLNQKLTTCKEDKVLSADSISNYQKWIDFIQFRTEKRQFHVYGLGPVQHIIDNTLVKELLDINAILKILMDQQTSKLVVFAGDAHIQTIALALQYEGYKVENANPEKVDLKSDKSLQFDLEEYANKENDKKLQGSANWPDFGNKVIVKKMTYTDQYNLVDFKDLNWIDNHLPEHLQINKHTDVDEIPITMPEWVDYLKKGCLGIGAFTCLATFFGIAAYLMY